MSAAVLFADVAGLELDAGDREVLAHPLVGGVVLFARNFASPAQLAALTASIHGLRVPPLLVAADQEGGRVQRFVDGFTRLPAACALGRLHDTAPRRALALCADVGAVMAAELGAVGVDVSFAPVLDVGGAPSAVIGERALHADPRVVARLAARIVAGMHASGLPAVGKHFPGHGSVVADSHVKLPRDVRSLDAILAHDAVPYRRLGAALDGLMTAHVLFEAVDGAPATCSRRWLQDVLRGTLGYDGLVFTDDLSMAAVARARSAPERVAAAFAAGCDVALLCNDRAAVCQVLDDAAHLPAPDGGARFARFRAARAARSAVSGAARDRVAALALG